LEAYTAILEAAEYVKKSRRTVAFTGAGISVGSGLMTFRGKDGIWKRFDPAEVGSIQAFLENPERFWRFAREIGPELLGSKPNPAHLALTQLQHLGLLGSIITQNIDGLHQAAGSVDVIELHGNIRSVSCVSCQAVTPSSSHPHILDQHSVPRCDACGGLLRPDIVLFGEKLPQEAYTLALRRVRSCTLLLTIGTAMEVSPASDLPLIAKEGGARIININPSPSEADNYADFSLYGPSEEIVPRIVHALNVIL